MCSTCVNGARKRFDRNICMADIATIRIKFFNVFLLKQSRTIHFTSTNYGAMHRIVILYVQLIPKKDQHVTFSALFSSALIQIPVLTIFLCIYVFPHGSTAPSGSGPPHYQGFTITLRQTILGRTHVDVKTARPTDLYLITHNTRKRQTSTPPSVFESAIPASERSHFRAPDCAVTGIGFVIHERHTDLKHSYVKMTDIF
jgi:hypothetical protein